MNNLARRLKKLEGLRFDTTGLVPHSDAWLDYWTDLAYRSLRGENVDCGRFSIEVLDRIMEAAVRAGQEQGA